GWKAPVGSDSPGTPARTRTKTGNAMWARQVRMFTFSATVGATATFAVGCTSTPAGDRVDLPSGTVGIGFDDLRYSATLHRVLVPGGRSGNLDLIDPD